MSAVRPALKTRIHTRIIPPIETARLTLFPCPALAAQAAGGGRRHMETLLNCPVDAEWFVDDGRGLLHYYANWVRGDPSQFGWGLWLIALRAQRTIIGSLGYKGRPDSMGEVELGYGIGRSFRKHGYTSEAAHAMINWAWHQPGVRVITAECLHTNEASRGVLRRIGMRYTHARGDFLYWRLERPAHV